jgi:hypothetical protein
MAFDGQFVKGITLKSRLNLIEDRWGKDAAAKVLEALPPDSKKVFTGLIASTNWYPFKIQVELDETICKVLARGNEDIFFELGIFAAQFQKETSAIKSISKDPWTFLQMQERVFQRYTRPGIMTVEMVGKNKAIMRIKDWQTTRNACAVNRGFVKEGITIAGGKNVVVEDLACCEDKGTKTCIYRISWE